MHSITDAVGRRGTCAVCGPDTELTSQGKCHPALRKAQRDYRYGLGPSGRKARKNRWVRPHEKVHVLSHRQGGPDVCSACGPVESFAQGRGFMCPNRAAELHWREPCPMPMCPRCDSELRSGTCPRCTPPRIEPQVREALLNGSLAVRASEIPMPEKIENAVPGWVTIGGPQPWNEKGRTPARL